MMFAVSHFRLPFRAGGIEGARTESLYLSSLKRPSNNLGFSISSLKKTKMAPWRRDDVNS